MARAGLGLGVRELAALANVSANAVTRLERGEEVREGTRLAVQRALEAAGVEFTNGDAPGVRLKSAGTGQRPKRRIGETKPARRRVGPEDEERGQQTGDRLINRDD